MIDVTAMDAIGMVATAAVLVFAGFTIYFVYCSIRDCIDQKRKK